MSANRKICVVTGSRAEYGLLRWVMDEVQANPSLTLQVVATGMHLAPQFGETYREIESHGFQIDAKVDMGLTSDTNTAVTKSLGLGVMGFAEAFEQLQPDMLVVLGDRFEILAAVQAAMLAKIPVAHIHGGEITEGAFDEGIRHAITKMAQWHFVAADAYRKRVVQMGEAPERVFNFGAPGLDSLSRLAWLSREELARQLDMDLGSPLFLVTYHPVTLGEAAPEEGMKTLLNALREFPQATIVLTHPNADPGGSAISKLLEDFARERSERTRAVVSLGQLRYLSLLRLSSVVIGNSSSGLIEAPVFKRATVNIGDRQKGRLKASSIVDAEENQDSIVRAIKTALSEEFQGHLKQTTSLYGQGEASRAIVSTLSSVPLQVRKSFFDVKHEF